MENQEWEKEICLAFENAINQGNVEVANSIATQLMQWDVRVQVALNLTAPPPVPLPSIPLIPNNNLRQGQGQGLNQGQIPRMPGYAIPNPQPRQVRNVDKNAIKDTLIGMGFAPILAAQASKKFETIEDALDFLSKKK